MKYGIPLVRIPDTSARVAGPSTQRDRLQTIGDPDLLERFNKAFRVDANVDGGSGSGHVNLPSPGRQWFSSYVIESFQPFAEYFMGIYPPHREQTPEVMRQWYLQASESLKQHASENPSFTFLTGASYLNECGLLRSDSDVHCTNLQAYFVFCIIGVLTCLYRPTTYGLTRQTYTIEEIETKTSHRYSCIYSGRIPLSEAGRPVRHALKRFGELMPNTDAVGTTKPDHPRPLYSTQINAHVLLGVVKINLEWTNIIGAHLDFDDRTKTLYVFRYPSFCLQNIILDRAEGTTTILHASITDEENEDGIVEDLMAEILLSLFVIFGQDAEARTFNQLHRALHDELRSNGDYTLQKICQGSWPFQDLGRERKEVYHLPTDFAITGAKLEYLRQLVLEQEPKGIKQLWKDKRNSLQWYTFWAVVLIGGVGVLLAFVQVVLSIMQVYYTATAGNQ